MVVRQYILDNLFLISYCFTVYIARLDFKLMLGVHLGEKVSADKLCIDRPTIKHVPTDRRDCHDPPAPAKIITNT